MLNILEKIKQTAATCLPSNVPHRKKEKTPIVLWSEEVQPFKDDALFWHSAWVSAGKPSNTELHKIMKRTRNIYHYQIRKCKQMVDTLKRNTLLDACINGNGDIFNEIRKLRKSSHNVANVIDGVAVGIPKHFAGIYSILYNSVEDRTSLDYIRHLINEKITQLNFDEVMKITPAIVSEAVDHLKSNKSDPIF